eukprot:scaffold9721_cov101-Skeletonema_dohrnii-CCMP3373.AAC.1
MPHSPRRPQHDSSNSSSHHHARKSPTMFELGQLAAAASEDSNPIIWEDDAGPDLRHLFTRRGNNDSNDDAHRQMLSHLTPLHATEVTTSSVSLKSLICVTLLVGAHHKNTQCNCPNTFEKTIVIHCCNCNIERDRN